MFLSTFPQHKSVVDPVQVRVDGHCIRAISGQRGGKPYIWNRNQVNPALLISQVDHAMDLKVGDYRHLS